VRCVYTRAHQLDPFPRAHCHLLIGRRRIAALVDTGADVTVIPEIHARLAGIEYAPASSALGVGGPVRTFVARSPVLADVDVPVAHGRKITWTHLGTHEIRPLIVSGPHEMTALIGRRDILIAYALTLIERDHVFELAPLA
jgi:hypothetical protein